VKKEPSKKPTFTGRVNLKNTGDGGEGETGVKHNYGWEVKFKQGNEEKDGEKREKKEGREGEKRDGRGRMDKKGTDLNQFLKQKE
jgi:hypothetical protein